MVEVISREIIKPSSPTPHHLQKLKLSYLDQSADPVFVPLIFFYQAADDNNNYHVQTSQRLKQSLSNALTSFYPLAGRIQDNFIVDCNDAGIEFVNARLDAQLHDAIQEPDEEDLKQYLPMDPSTYNTTHEDGPLLFVQINSFECGGIAIGMCFSHRIADCESIMAFIKAWAATNCQTDPISQSLISFGELANYFPGRELPPGPLLPMMPGKKFRMKRFVFDKAKLAALRQIASICPSRDDNLTTAHVKNPTRVELVSAFIWKHFMDNEYHEAKKAFVALHSANLRARKCPPQLLENVFGNCLMLAFAHGTSDHGYHQLISKLRNSIRNIDDDYITKSQSRGNNYLDDFFKFMSPITRGEMDLLGFSSWCRFPVYEIDFGWGKPIWMCTAGVPVKFNATILVSTRCGEGIEALVWANKENLDIIGANFQIISNDCVNDDTKG